MASKIELEKKVKTLEEELEKLQLEQCRGVVKDLAKTAIAFSHNGNVARIKLDKNGEILFNSDEKSFLISPISCSGFNIIFRESN